MHPARKRRLELQLTQAEVARRTGIPRNRLNEYEAGRRFLSSEALDKLKRELQVDFLVGADNCLSEADSARFCTAFPWDIHVDPGTTWATIPPKYAKHYKGLKLHNRPPLEFRALVRCDSALEALTCDYLFECGAKPLFSNPLALGFQSHALLDSAGHGYGLALRASFRIPRRNCELLWWPQVPFYAAGLHLRADALVLDSRGHWFFLEIDGDAHGGNEWDSKRDATIAVPVLRFGSSAILNFDMLELLDQHLND
jgi:transcriptional regulator with XRE-family HTH domain